MCQTPDVIRCKVLRWKLNKVCVCENWKLRSQDSSWRPCTPHGHTTPHSHPAPGTGAPLACRHVAQSIMRFVCYHSHSRVAVAALRPCAALFPFLYSYAPFLKCRCASSLHIVVFIARSAVLLFMALLTPAMTLRGWSWHAHDRKQWMDGWMDGYSSAVRFVWYTLGEEYLGTLDRNLFGV
jgi:hypothetical protein